MLGHNTYEAPPREDGPEKSEDVKEICKHAFGMVLSCRKNSNLRGRIRAHHFALAAFEGSETPPARVGVILFIGNVALKSRF